MFINSSVALIERICFTLLWNKSVKLAVTVLTVLVTLRINKHPMLNMRRQDLTALRADTAALGSSSREDLHMRGNADWGKVADVAHILAPARAVAWHLGDIVKGSFGSRRPDLLLDRQQINELPRVSSVSATAC
jgi:hypothetical protein